MHKLYIYIYIYIYKSSIKLDRNVFSILIFFSSLEYTIIWIENPINDFEPKKKKMIVNRPEHREYRKEEPISLKWQDSLQKPVKWAYGPKMIYADQPGLVLKERTYRLPTGLSSVIMTIGMMMGLNALFVHAYDLDFRYECVVWRLRVLADFLGSINDSIS